MPQAITLEDEKHLLEVEETLRTAAWTQAPDLKWVDPVTGQSYGAETAFHIHIHRLDVGIH